MFYLADSTLDAGITQGDSKVDGYVRRRSRVVCIVRCVSLVCGASAVPAKDRANRPWMVIPPLENLMGTKYSACGSRRK